MTSNTDERIARFASLLERDGLDGALVTHLINIRYLTGFSGSNAALFVTNTGDVTIATDGRYRDQILAETQREAIIANDVLEALTKNLQGNIGFEAQHLSVEQYQQLQSVSQAHFVAIGSHIERMREVKDDIEIAAIKQACEISVAALTGLLNGPIIARSEREIARDLESRMFELGAEALGFETICAAGENSAIPHHAPTHRIVGKGDLLKIDFGARVDGYHADCTRTFVIGPASDWQREIYAAVQGAQRAGVAALIPGSELKDARIAVDVSLGDWGEYFTTGLGHGVGLEIHEDPFLRLTNTGRVVPQIALTVEPGIYFPGRGGVRIEDTLLTTDTMPRALSEFTRDLLEL